MPKTKISEFSSTPASNTDIDSINIAEGCAPSGINDAIRELMAQLKDFQTGAVGDSFNGPVGTTTAAAGAFTTLSASSTVSGTGFSTYLASPPAIGGTAAAAVSATTLTTSSTVTLNGGTANGVAYLNGSKVVTSGSALTFDGSFANLTLTSGTSANGFLQFSNSADGGTQGYIGDSKALISGGANSSLAVRGESNILFGIASAEGMRLTSTGLGIGTSSPSQKLDVAGQVTISSGNGYLWGNGAVQMYSNSSYLRFRTASTDRLEIDSSGNLGLGVTPSAWATLRGLQNGRANLVGYVSNAEGAWLTNNAFYDGSWKYQVSSQATHYQQLSGVHSWHNAASGTAGNTITFTQAMTLDASGNLMVGTTTANGRLTVNTAETKGQNATTAVFGTSTGGSSDFQLVLSRAASSYYSIQSVEQNVANRDLVLQPNGGNLLVGTTTSSSKLTLDGIQTYRDGADSRVGTIKMASGAFQIGTNTAHEISFLINSSEAARFDGNKNFLVGTTTAGAKFTLEYAGTSAVGQNINDSADTTNSTLMQFLIQGTQVGTIKRVAATSAVVYNTTSDYRLKTVTGAVAGQGARIDALKPIDYQWKEGGEQARGFLAHEFETVYPNSVSGTKDAIDADGNPVYQAMQAATSEVIADLVAEIQSLRKRLADAGI